MIFVPLSVSGIKEFRGLLWGKSTNRGTVGKAYVFVLKG